LSYKGFNEHNFFDKYKFEVGQLLAHKDYKRLVCSGFLHDNFISTSLSGIILTTYYFYFISPYIKALKQQLMNIKLLSVLSFFIWIQFNTLQAQNLEKLRESSQIGNERVFAEVHSDILVMQHAIRIKASYDIVTDYINPKGQLLTVRDRMITSNGYHVTYTISNQTLYVLLIEKGTLSIETYDIAQNKLTNKINSKKITDVLKQHNIKTGMSPEYKVRSLSVDENSKATIYLNVNWDIIVLTWDMNNISSLTPIVQGSLPQINFENAYRNYDAFKNEKEDWQVVDDYNGNYYYSHLFSRENNDVDLIDSCIYFITTFDRDGKETKSFILNANSTTKKSFIYKSPLSLARRASPGRRDQYSKFIVL
jgi:hypothetical protein